MRREGNGEGGGGERRMVTRLGRKKAKRAGVRDSEGSSKGESDGAGAGVSEDKGDVRDRRGLGRK